MKNKIQQFGDYIITSIYHDSSSEYEIVLTYKGKVVIEDCLPINSELAKENAEIIIRHFTNLAKHAAEQIALINGRLNKAKGFLREVINEANELNLD